MQGRGRGIHVHSPQARCGFPAFRRHRAGAHGKALRSLRGTPGDASEQAQGRAVQGQDRPHVGNREVAGTHRPRTRRNGTLCAHPRPAGKGTAQAAGAAQAVVRIYIKIFIWDVMVTALSVLTWLILYHT